MVAGYHIVDFNEGINVAEGGITGRGFRKGQSGNPGGRPKLVMDVIALAKEHTPLAITTLASIARNDEAPPAARATAAVALLDRGWGRPAQTVTGENGAPLQIDFRWADSAPTILATPTNLMTIDADVVE